MDREKVIEHITDCVKIADCQINHNWVFVRTDILRDALALLKSQEPITGETSDGYHTFNELYHHRAVLFSVIVANYPDRAWKSVRHHDGTMYDGMFIVGIDTPDGQATYHYDIDPYWGMFNCLVLDNAPEWDGHTPAQAIERIGKLKAQEPLLITHIHEEYPEHLWKKDENGNVNEWAMEFDYHQGPVCERCGDTFCIHCEPDGYITHKKCVVDVYKCPKCGSELRSNQKHCAKCGQAVKWE